MNFKQFFILLTLIISQFTHATTKVEDKSKKIEKLIENRRCNSNFTKEQLVTELFTYNPFIFLEEWLESYKTFEKSKSFNPWERKLESNKAAFDFLSKQIRNQLNDFNEDIKRVGVKKLEADGKYSFKYNDYKKISKEFNKIAETENYSIENVFILNGIFSYINDPQVNKFLESTYTRFEDFISQARSALYEKEILEVAKEFPINIHFLEWQVNSSKSRYLKEKNSAKGYTDLENIHYSLPLRPMDVDNFNLSFEVNVKRFYPSIRDFFEVSERIQVYARMFKDKLKEKSRHVDRKNFVYDMLLESFKEIEETNKSISKMY